MTCDNGDGEIGGALTTARDFFERARAASIDAERCRTQLLALESRARSLGGGRYEPRTKSTPDPQRMQGRVAAYIDMEKKLQERMDADYELIDRATVVLYGDDRRRGIDSAQSPVWADVLWWRYLDDATWDAIGRVVGYSRSQCQIFCKAALAWIDETRFMADVMDGA